MAWKLQEILWSGKIDVKKADCEESLVNLWKNRRQMNKLSDRKWNKFIIKRE